MAWSRTIRRWGSPRGLSAALLTALLLSPVGAAADLNGRWYFNFGPTGFTDITDAGGSVSFVLTVNSFTVQFSGTVSGSTLNATSNDGCFSISAGVASNEDSISGSIFLFPSCGGPAVG